MVPSARLLESSACDAWPHMSPAAEVTVSSAFWACWSVMSSPRPEADAARQSARQQQHSAEPGCRMVGLRPLRAGPLQGAGSSGLPHVASRRSGSSSLLSSCAALLMLDSAPTAVPAAAPAQRD